MNFDERLAQTQAKLDDLKAKINESIDSAKEAHQINKDEALVKLAKMNASIEDFGRDVEAQVYCDVTSMKAEAKADADAIGSALDEIGDKIDAKAEKMDKALDSLDDKIDAKADADFEKMDKAFDKLDAKTAATAEKMDKALDDLDAKAAATAEKMDKALDDLDAKAAAKAEKMDKALDDLDSKISAKVDDSVATVEGDFNATEENFRIAKDRYNSKLNSIRLKVQMHLEEIKSKIEGKKTEIDKAAQEDLIMDLLDYADDCQMIAYAYAMEAELAILDACDEIEDYEAKYGKMD